MKVLFIINDAPYGTEKTYNALRMTMAVQKQPGDNDVYVVLMADSVACALPGRTTPNGYYSIERMLKAVINNRGQAKSCGGCSEARGVNQLPLIDGVEVSNMGQLFFSVANFVFLGVRHFVRTAAGRCIELA